MLNDKVVEYCCTFPFTLLCDGGNGQTDRKYFGIMVRYWDKEADQPAKRFLCMTVCNIATAEALFTAIEKEFGSHKIPWSNMVGYASDTASVMVSETTKVIQSCLPLPLECTVCCCCT